MGASSFPVDTDDQQARSNNSSLAGSPTHGHDNQRSPIAISPVHDGKRAPPPPPPRPKREKKRRSLMAADQLLVEQKVDIVVECPTPQVVNEYALKFPPTRTRVLSDEVSGDMRCRSLSPGMANVKTSGAAVDPDDRDAKTPTPCDNEEVPFCRINDALRSWEGRRSASPGNRSLLNCHHDLGRDLSRSRENLGPFQHVNRLHPQTNDISGDDDSIRPSSSASGVTLMAASYPLSPGQSTTTLVVNEDDSVGNENCSMSQHGMKFSTMPHSSAANVKRRASAAHDHHVSVSGKSTPASGSVCGSRDPRRHSCCHGFSTPSSTASMQRLSSALGRTASGHPNHFNQRRFIEGGPGSMETIGHTSMTSLHSSASIMSGHQRDSSFQLNMPLSSKVKQILVSNEVLDEVQSSLTNYNGATILRKRKETLRQHRLSVGTADESPIKMNPDPTGGDMEDRVTQQDEDFPVKKALSLQNSGPEEKAIDDPAALQDTDGPEKTHSEAKPSLSTASSILGFPTSAMSPSKMAAALGTLGRRVASSAATLYWSSLDLLDSCSPPGLKRRSRSRRSSTDKDGDAGEGGAKHRARRSTSMGPSRFFSRSNQSRKENNDRHNTKIEIIHIIRPESVGSSASTDGDHASSLGSVSIPIRGNASVANSSTPSPTPSLSISSVIENYNFHNSHHHDHELAPIHGHGQAFVQVHGQPGGNNELPMIEETLTSFRRGGKKKDKDPNMASKRSHHKDVDCGSSDSGATSGSCGSDSNCSRLGMSHEHDHDDSGSMISVSSSVGRHVRAGGDHPLMVERLSPAMVHR